MKEKVKFKTILLFLSGIVLLFFLGFPLAMLMGENQGKVEMNETLSLPFSVNDDKKIVLLYFGYAGCQTICTPSLEEIASIYEKVEKTKEVVFYFINISEGTAELDVFVQYFHKEFIGLELPLKERQVLMNDLRVYTSASLRQNGEMSHTGYLYMVKKKSEQNFELKAMYYTRPFNQKSIVEDIYKELK